MGGSGYVGWQPTCHVDKKLYKIHVTVKHLFEIVKKKLKNRFREQLAMESDDEVLVPESSGRGTSATQDGNTHIQ